MKEENNMKKVYNQPAIEIVRLQPFRLMEGSLPVTVSSNNYDAGTQTLGAKDGGFWDDDEPEEVGW